MLELVLGYWFWKKSNIILELGVKWLGGDLQNPTKQKSCKSETKYNRAVIIGDCVGEGRVVRHQTIDSCFKGELLSNFNQKNMISISQQNVSLFIVWFHWILSEFTGCH